MESSSSKLTKLTPKRAACIPCTHLAKITYPVCKGCPLTELLKHATADGLKRLASRYNGDKVMSILDTFSSVEEKLNWLNAEMRNVNVADLSDGVADANNRLLALKQTLLSSKEKLAEQKKNVEEMKIFVEEKLNVAMAKLSVAEEDIQALESHLKYAESVVELAQHGVDELCRREL